MVAFGHTAVGVIVGVTAYRFIGQTDLMSGLVITGSVGMVSHYLMDALPHGHFFGSGNYKKQIIPVIIFDLFLSIVIFLGGIYLLDGFSIRLFYTVFGIGGSQLPDVIDGLISIRAIKAAGLLKVENNLHQRLHWHGKSAKTLLLGQRDFWQVLVVLAALLYLFLG